MVGAAQPAIELARLWADNGLDAGALARIELTGADPVLPCSFAVGTVAQVSTAAAALAATEIGRARNGLTQGASVDMLASALECTAWFSIDGRTPEQWDKISGLYRCAEGWVRIHANFAHHRDGALRLLGLAPGVDTPRGAVEAALLKWNAFEFEQAAADAQLVVAALRRFDQWDAHPQAVSVAALPLVTIEKIGAAAPRKLPSLAQTARPLAGIKVLELTRILAGPVCGRTLAAYGADVMLVNSPKLPNIESIIDTSRGKLSCLVDLEEAGGRADLRALLSSAHVFVQGYRPGALDERGFGPADAAQLCSGVVYVSLSAYGEVGPWAARRGFDSLVQTATGFNHAEMLAAGASAPKPLPVQILDYASGFLMAFGAQAALIRQAREGGSWHVRVSLARTALWLRSLARVENGLAIPLPVREAHLETMASGWGELKALRHAGMLTRTPSGWNRQSVRPGTHAPRWCD